jgi:hypothetical protein
VLSLLVSGNNSRGSSVNFPPSYGVLKLSACRQEAVEKFAQAFFSVMRNCKLSDGLDLAHQKIGVADHRTTSRNTRGASVSAIVALTA